MSQISKWLARSLPGHAASWEHWPQDSQGAGLAASAALWPRFALQALRSTGVGLGALLSKHLSLGKWESEQELLCQLFTRWILAVQI